MPQVDLSRFDRAQMSSTLDGAGKAIGGAASEAGKNAASLASDAGKTAASLASDAGKTAASLAGDAGKAAATLAAGAGSSVSDLASGAGKAASGAVSDAGRIFGSVLESFGDKIRDVRASEPPPPPPGASRVQRGVMALAVASIVGSIAAGIAFFFHPSRGAARRTAIRRRLGMQAGMARNSVGTAREAAKRAGDRAAELVRIPIETARDRVRGGTDGSSDEDGAADLAAIAGGGPAGTAAIETPDDIGNLSPSPAAPWEEGASISTEGDGTLTDQDAASGIYGTPNVLNADGQPESLDAAEERAQAEAVGE